MTAPSAILPTSFVCVIDVFQVPGTDTDLPVVIEPTQVRSLWFRFLVSPSHTSLQGSPPSAPASVVDGIIDGTRNVPASPTEDGHDGGRTPNAAQTRLICIPESEADELAEDANAAGGPPPAGSAPIARVGPHVLYEADRHPRDLAGTTFTQAHRLPYSHAPALLFVFSASSARARPARTAILTGRARRTCRSRSKVRFGAAPRRAPRAARADRPRAGVFLPRFRCFNVLSAGAAGARPVLAETFGWLFRVYSTKVRAGRACVPRAGRLQRACRSARASRRRRRSRTCVCARARARAAPRSRAAQDLALLGVKVTTRGRGSLFPSVRAAPSRRSCARASGIWGD
jgi:hypothetical protein